MEVAAPSDVPATPDPRASLTSITTATAASGSPPRDASSAAGPPPGSSLDGGPSVLSSVTDLSEINANIASLTVSLGLEEALMEVEGASDDTPGRLGLGAIPGAAARKRQVAARRRRQEILAGDPRAKVMPPDIMEASQFGALVGKRAEATLTLNRSLTFLERDVAVDTTRCKSNALRLGDLQSRLQTLQSRLRLNMKETDPVQQEADRKRRSRMTKRELEREKVQDELQRKAVNAGRTTQDRVLQELQLAMPAGAEAPCPTCGDTFPAHYLAHHSKVCSFGTGGAGHEDGDDSDSDNEGADSQAIVKCDLCGMRVRRGRLKQHGMSGACSRARKRGGGGVNKDQAKRDAKKAQQAAAAAAATAAAAAAAKTTTAGAPSAPNLTVETAGEDEESATMRQERLRSVANAELSALNPELHDRMNRVWAGGAGAGTSAADTGVRRLMRRMSTDVHTGDAGAAGGAAAGSEGDAPDAAPDAAAAAAAAAADGATPKGPVLNTPTLRQLASKRNLSAAALSPSAMSYATDASAATNTSTSSFLPPQAPRKVRVIATTCNSIELAWEPPLFDGGLPIHDYVISFRKVMIKGKAKKAVMLPQPEVHTSRWVHMDPVCHTGATLTGLEADTTYGNIYVSAKSAAGQGCVSSCVSMTKTQPAEPISAPLGFRCTATHGFGFDLAWREPIFFGGRRLKEYRLTFTARFMFDSHELEVTEHEYTVPGNVTTFTATELSGGYAHEDVTLVPVAEDGSTGEPSRIDGAIELRVGGRRRSLIEELIRAKHATGDVIDTIALSQTVQRVNRAAFISALEKEIAAMPSDGKDDDEELLQVAQAAGPQAENAADKESQAAVDLLLAAGGVSQPATNRALGAPRQTDRTAGRMSAVVSGMTTVAGTPAIDPLQDAFRVRREQFQHRIAQLKSMMEDLEDRKAALLAERNELVNGHRETVERLNVLGVELNRFAGMSNPRRVVHSTVPTGAAQEYRLGLLRCLLANEAVALRRTIVESVRDVKVLEVKRQSLAKRTLDAQMALRSRERKLKDVTKIYLKLQSNETMRQVMFGTKRKAFRMMKQLLVLRRERQRTAVRSAKLMQNVMLAKGWRTWIGVVRHAQFQEWRMQQLRMPQKDAGIGSLALMQVKETRYDVIRDVMDLLQNVGEGLKPERGERELEVADAVVSPTTADGKTRKPGNADDTPEEDLARWTPWKQFPVPLAKLLQTPDVPMPSGAHVSVPGGGDSGGGSGGGGAGAGGGRSRPADPGTVTDAGSKQHRAQHLLLGQTYFASGTQVQLAQTEFAHQLRLDSTQARKDAELDTAFEWALRREKVRRSRERRPFKALHGLPPVLAGDDLTPHINKAFEHHKEEKQKRARRVLWLLLRIGDCHYLGGSDVRVAVCYHQFLDGCREQVWREGEAFAMERLVLAYHQRGSLAEAARWAGTAAGAWARMNNSAGQLRALQLLQTVQHQRGDFDAAERTEQIINMVELNDSVGESTTLESRVADGHRVLEQWEGRLRGGVANVVTPDVVLERVTHRVPIVRQEIKQQKLDLRKLRRQLQVTQQEFNQAKVELERYAYQLKVIETTQVRTIETDVLHGVSQQLSVEAAREALTKAIKHRKKLAKDLTNTVQVSELRLKNMQDDLRGMEEELLASTSRLAQAAARNLELRVAAFYPGNMMAGNAMGRGGVFGMSQVARGVTCRCGLEVVLGGDAALREWQEATQKRGPQDVVGTGGGADALSPTSVGGGSPTRRRGEVPNTDSEPELELPEPWSVVCRRCKRRVGGQNLGLVPMIIGVRNTDVFMYRSTLGRCLGVLAGRVGKPKIQLEDMSLPASVSTSPTRGGSSVVLDSRRPVTPSTQTVHKSGQVSADSPGFMLAADAYAKATSPNTKRKNPGAPLAVNTGMATATQVAEAMAAAERLEHGIVDGHSLAVTCVEMAATDVYTGSVDGTVRCWAYKSSKCYRVLEGHTGTVWSLCANFDNKTLLSGSADCTARVWDLETGRCVRILKKHEKTVRCVGIWHSLVATGGADGLVGVWDMTYAPPPHLRATMRVGRTAGIHGALEESRIKAVQEARKHAKILSDSDSMEDVTDSDDSGNDSPGADFLEDKDASGNAMGLLDRPGTTSDDPTLTEVERLVQARRGGGKAVTVKTESAYRALARRDRLARGMPEDSSDDESDEFDAEQWLEMQEVKNEYEVTEKGRLVLKNQRRGFFGFDMDREFRRQKMLRKKTDLNHLRRERRRAVKQAEELVGLRKTGHVDLASMFGGGGGGGGGGGAGAGAGSGGGVAGSPKLIRSSQGKTKSLLQTEDGKSAMDEERRRVIADAAARRRKKQKEAPVLQELSDTTTSVQPILPQRSATLAAHDAPVTALKLLSPLLITCDAHGVLIQWDLEKMEVLYKIDAAKQRYDGLGVRLAEQHRTITCLEFTTRQIVLGYTDGALEVRHFTSGQRLSQLWPKFEKDDLDVAEGRTGNGKDSSSGCRVLAVQFDDSTVVAVFSNGCMRQWRMSLTC